MYHIYVVDDDLTVQRELKVLLENQGYRTTIAQKFTSIPEEIEDVKPDLILLDIFVTVCRWDYVVCTNTYVIRGSYYFCHFTKIHRQLN